MKTLNHGKPEVAAGGSSRQPERRGGNCCGAIPRREFLKIAGLGATSASLSGPLRIMAGPFTRAEGLGEHLVPADKKLAAEWVRSLFAKGEPEVFRGRDLATIGMPVGGIGAGQLYLLGDGTLGCWQIFNEHHFSGYGQTSYQYRVPESPVEQGFAVIVEADGKRTPRRLSIEDFPGVTFRGEYPIGRVSYADESFPVRIEMEAFSPFIPLNAKDSGLPGTVFNLTVANRSNAPVKVNLIGWLANAACCHSAEFVYDRAVRRTRILSEKGRTLIVHSAEPRPEGEQPAARPAIVLADFEGETYGEWKATGKAFGDGPAKGTFAGQNKVSGFEGQGLVNTWLHSDEPHGTLTSPEFEINRRFLNFKIGGGKHPKECCINLIVDGQVALTATGGNDEKLKWHTWNVRRFQGKTARIRIVDRHSGGWGHINIDQIELSDEARIGRGGPIPELSDFGSLALAFAGSGLSPAATRELLAVLGDSARGFHAETDATAPLDDPHTTAMATPAAEIAPGDSQTFTFVLSWFFPNRELGRGKGHMYANWFDDAAGAAHYVLDHIDRLAGDTRRWRDTYYDSTLPVWLLDRLHSTVSNLATGTAEWWKNGRFWAWEGVFCCHGTCTHVWNYAHAVARLFPGLECSAREMQDLDAALHGDGLVGFRGDRNGHYAADGQAGTVLKCYREHQMSADDAFLRRNWPNIKKVLEYSIGHDANDDGLIEDSQHNTFDINFVGPNTFVGSLYLAALRAGEEIAREVGDADFALRVRRIFDSGYRLSAERLFNGEYFIQLVDLEKHPKHQYGDGCLSDQVFGQGWAEQLRLGYIYPREQVRQALQSVWKYNWAPDVGPFNAAHKPQRYFASPGEAGLFTCTWPHSRHLDQGVLYREEVWTGIEYQVAGHMIWENMLTEAMVICRAVHDRYHPSKHNPYNEVECGDHYARALASWGVFTALAGYEYHGPKGHLGFAPRLAPEDFRAAFTAAEGWGTFSQKRQGATQQERIDVRWGRLRLRTLAFAVADNARPTQVTVAAAGRQIAVRHKLADGRITIELPDDVTLKEGESLTVQIA